MIDFRCAEARPHPVDSTAWTGDPDPSPARRRPGDVGLLLKVGSRIGLSPGGTPFGRAVVIAAATVATIGLHWVEFALWPEAMEQIASMATRRRHSERIVFGVQWCAVAYVLNLYCGLFRRERG